MVDEKFNFDLNNPEAIPGVITKVARLSSLEATDEDMKKINKYSLEPLTKEEVFVFKATIADNEQDDRNYMPFNLKSLMDMKKLYPGKTMLKDHRKLADNQIARVFDTEISQSDSRKTELGELHTELTAKMFMVRTESNKDLIAEIRGGIKKEVSTSTVPKNLICNICKGDGRRCRHYPGLEYTIEDGTEKGRKRRCKMLIDGVNESYELSFVAVPAQPRAGTHKSVGFAKITEDDKFVVDGEEIGHVDGDNIAITNKEIAEIAQNEVEMDERILTARIKNAESVFN